MLNWDDETFWDSSLRFLFKQFDIHIEGQKRVNKPRKQNKNQPNTIKGERKKFKVMSEAEVIKWRMKGN